MTTTDTVVPRATRDESAYGRMTHTERINGFDMPTRYGVDPMPKAPERTDYAHADHPDGVRHPYRTTSPAFADGRKLPPGTVQWLLPHEPGKHHVYAPEHLPKANPEADEHRHDDHHDGEGGGDEHQNHAEQA